VDSDAQRLVMRAFIADDARFVRALPDEPSFVAQIGGRGRTRADSSGAG